MPVVGPDAEQPARQTAQTVLTALGYDERFLRIWTYYLSYCEAAFAMRSLRDVQLVLSRSFNDALPAHPAIRPTY